ncbi:MAG: U32 family peptidase [Bacteroidales bacterium]|nr:U32 family peptidase [Bacteroidales bacterium]
MYNDFRIKESEKINGNYLNLKQEYSFRDIIFDGDSVLIIPIISMSSLPYKSIELLSPAKDLECGLAAIDFGADAVYIGAHSFSARAAAANSIEDISKLINYAHLFNVKVYVALNTILYTHELESVKKLIHELYVIGADAIIIQDYGILELDIPPIEIHASTQMNNRTIEQVQFLEKCGFAQVVLARELSISMISELRKQTNVKLECFIHGALCVSYSGNCFISQTVAGRSANRGECAQFCRHKYSLIDATDKEIFKGHLLSLKDMCLEDSLEQLLLAGVDSFKIEGRLKDRSYVKNTTLHYRNKLDEIFKKNTNYKKTSVGKIISDINTQLDCSFNRGFTDYFANNENKKIASFNSPKSQGEYLGVVVKENKHKITIETNKVLAPEDGICYIDENKEMQGFKIEVFEGNEVFVNKSIKIGTVLYRNQNTQFNFKLDTSRTARKIAISFHIIETETGIYIQVKDEVGDIAELFVDCDKIPANDISKSKALIINQFSKLGDTVFTCDSVSLKFHKEVLFFRTSFLNEIRRDIINILISNKLCKTNNNNSSNLRNKIYPNYYDKEVDYKLNISNSAAELFLKTCGVEIIENAVEIELPKNKIIVMNTKYCLRRELGKCKKTIKNDDLHEPLFIQDNTGKYELFFDCKKCEMFVIK